MKRILIIVSGDKMKLNNKGFAITTILYGTMVLFLMLSVASLGIMSTYKIRMDKLINEEEGAECIVSGECVDSLTCSLSVDANKNVVVTSANQSDTLSYSFDGGSSWQASNTKMVTVNSQTGSLTIQAKNSSGNVATCGNVSVTMIKKTTSYCEAAGWSYTYPYVPGQGCATVYTTWQILSNSTCGGRPSGYTECISGYVSMDECMENGISDGACKQMKRATYNACTSRHYNTPTWVADCNPNTGCEWKTQTECSGTYSVTVN